ncbi:MAG: exodeoxyribonuclease VII large subunit [Clostridia bacterium]
MATTQNIINVSILTGYIHNVFVAEEMLHDVCVCGEISGYKAYGLHSYFTLKDENSQISCCCFNYARTYAPKKDGESVVLCGDVDFYAKNGKLTFNVKTIQPLGDGLLAIQLEALKNKLSLLGYFDDSKKKPIPPYPRRVGIISSENGAVIKDIVTTVRRSNDIIDLVLCDVRVQGKDCAKDIIARGGGSLEDLMPFNDENLVYAIFEAKTPIISAVGHQTDFTLCDLVADMRVATPTAAAEAISYNKNDMLQWLEDNKTKFQNNVANIIERKVLNNNLLKTRILKVFEQKYSTNYHNLELFKQKLSNNVEMTFEKNIAIFQNYLTKLDAYNPARLMQKGYFSINKNYTILTKIGQLNKQDIIEIVGCDGKATAQILEVKNEI